MEPVTNAQEPRPKILVADDERHWMRYVQTHLEHAGYEVVTAHDYQEALELALAQRPDLVVLDTMMPCMPVSRHEPAYYVTVHQPPPEPQGCLARLLRIPPREEVPTEILHLTKFDAVEDFRNVAATDTPILLMSAKSSTCWFACKWDPSGADRVAVLMKPFAPSDLVSVVRTFLPAPGP